MTGARILTSKPAVSLVVLVALLGLLAITPSPTYAANSDYTDVKVENKKTGLVMQSWPVARPQTFGNPCSPGSLKLFYKSGKPFKVPAFVTYAIAAPAGAYGPSAQSEIKPWPAFTQQEPLKMIAPNYHGISLQICPSDVPLGTESHVKVKIELRDSKNKVIDKLNLDVPILDSELAGSMNNLVAKCLDGQNPSNLTVAQTTGTNLRRDKWTSAIIGTTAKLEGTLFVNNVALKNTEIVFFEEFKNKSGAWQLPGRQIGKTITDELGQFEVTLKLSRVYPESYSTVTAMSRPTVQVIGPGAVVLPAAGFNLKFDWLLYPGYYAGNKRDLPPVPDQDCSLAYGSFLDLIENEDERNRLVRYVVLHELGRWFNGYKERGRYQTVQCYDQSWGAACNYFETGIAAPNSSNAFGSLGTRCWHRQGHTRRTESGKITYVDAHRACRK